MRSGGETYRKQKHNESQLQMLLARWLRQKKIFYTASLLGVNLGARVGAIRKAMGVNPGDHDIIILMPSRQFHGMTLELKVKGGNDEDENQIRFQIRATELGYYSVIMPATMDFQEAYDWAVREIEAYLQI